MLQIGNMRKKAYVYYIAVIYVTYVQIYHYLVLCYN